MNPVACVQMLNGRVLRIEGDQVIIGFQNDGETEEREFSRDDLNVNDDLIKVGALVLATTYLEFLRPTAKPMPEEDHALRERIDELENAWYKIDPH